MQVAELDDELASAARSMSVITVWAAHGGVGASVLSLALAEAAHATAVNVALIDLGDPARSGLAGVCLRERRTITTTPQLDDMRQGDRGVIPVRRVAPRRTSPTTPRRLPAPSAWLGTLASSVELVVVDIGCAPTTISGEDLDALTAWLDLSVPVVVGRPTLPSLQLCEGVLALIERHRNGGGVHLAITGAPPWPPSLLPTAGRRTEQAITEANAIPLDPDLEWQGCTTEPLPTAVVEAAARLLARMLPGAIGTPPALTGHPGRFRTPLRRRPGRG